MANRYILIVTNKVDDFACYKLGAKEGDYEFDYPGLPTAMLDEIEKEGKDWDVMTKTATFLIYDVKEYTTPAELEGKKEDGIFVGTGLELLRELRRRNYDSV